MKKFTYEIDCIEWKKTVTGYRLTPNFATRLEWNRFWILTHLPTGFSVPHCSTRTRAKQLRLAKRIERVRDWSKKCSGSQIPWSHKYAVITIAKGKSFADRWLKTERAAKKAAA
jgi:hypothetical protein